MSRWLEKTTVRLGFIPLTDCAPIAVAREQGLFAEQGLDVKLQREVSWANIRDKLALGVLDVAQMPASMPLAAALGVGGPRTPLCVPCALNLGGNAITVSRELYGQMCVVAPEAMRQRPFGAAALKRVLQIRRDAGMEPPTFGHVFPTSTHAYLLRYWLRAAGIEPDRDVRLRVVPPPHMVRELELGHLAGYCVGEPWNALAVERGSGVSLISSYEIWNNSMEKVLGCTRDWAERHPNAVQALLRALLRAAQWLERPSHRSRVISLLARSDYVGLPRRVLAPALSGQFHWSAERAPLRQPDFLVFQRYAATFPWHSQARWYAEQMRTAGQLPAGADPEAAIRATYRTDLYRQAARALRLPAPTVDDRPAGAHPGRWKLKEATAALTLGADLLFDAGSAAVASRGAGAMAQAQYEG